MTLSPADQNQTDQTSYFSIHKVFAVTMRVSVQELKRLSNSPELHTWLATLTTGRQTSQLKQKVDRSSHKTDSLATKHQ